jgi:toxin YhaV
MSVVNGWRLFAHAEFLDQVERLTEAVERERARDPEGYARAANFKLLSAVRKLIFETIPANPALPAFRQGGTLGASRKHWFRAKFGGQRFRLFFRFDSVAKIIIYALVNDAQTLRTYGSKTDAYAVFKAMLDRGRPPDDWAALLAEATSMDIERPS